MWRWIIALIIIAALIAVIVLAARQPMPVETDVIARGPISRIVEERAKTRVPRTYAITMPIAGRVQPIDLDEGDAVRAGQVVAQIEMADLETAVQMAQARVDRLGASIIENNDSRLEMSTLEQLVSFLESVDRSVDAAEAQTVASKARQDYRETDLERKQRVAEQAAATTQEVEQAQLDAIESQVDYRSDILNWRGLEAIKTAARIWPLQVRQVIDKKSLAEAVLKHELAEAHAALEQAIRDRERAAIRTPVDGVVLARAVSSQRMLAAGELLLEIGRMEDLEIEVEVLSEEAVDIEAGDRVEIEVPTVKHDPLAGTVRTIEPRGFTKISSLGVEQQRVLVIVAFDAEDVALFREAGHDLGIGYRLRVGIITETHASSLVIPRIALFRGAGDQWQAFVIRDGRARLADLTIGLLNDTHAEVLGGLQEGDQVILAPETGLADGDRVRAR